jgi:hypothetical protein
VAEAAPFILNPKDEFESALIVMTLINREKAKGYGSSKDQFANFYDAADILDVSPLAAALFFRTKHDTAVRRWWNGHYESVPQPTSFSDDAYTDRAVYGVIELCLYRRLKEVI